MANSEIKKMILSKQRGKDVFRVEFLFKNINYSQEELVGFSEKKYKIPVWVER